MISHQRAWICHPHVKLQVDFLLVYPHFNILVYDISCWLSHICEHSCSCRSPLGRQQPLPLFFFLFVCCGMNHWGILWCESWILHLHSWDHWRKFWFTVDAVADCYVSRVMVQVWVERSGHFTIESRSESSCFCSFGPEFYFTASVKWFICIKNGG